MIFAAARSAARQAAQKNARKNEQAFHVPAREPARVQQHPPQPFASDGLKRFRGTPLVTGEKIKAGTDANERDAVDFPGAAICKNFLLGRAEGHETNAGSGVSDKIYSFRRADRKSVEIMRGRVRSGNGQVAVTFL